MKLSKKLKAIIFIFLLISTMFQNCFIVIAVGNGFVKEWGVTKDNNAIIQNKVEKLPYKGLVLAPKAIFIGTNTIVLKPQPDYEYLVVLHGQDIKNGLWQSSNRFYYLKHNTEYDFYQRVKETDQYLKSHVSERLTVRTKNLLYKGMYNNWFSQNQDKNSPLSYYPSPENSDSSGVPEENDKLKGVTITGNNSYGATLEACMNNDNLAKNDHEYQWQRNNKDIPGANNDSYKLTKDDIGKKIRVVVKQNNPSQSVISNETPLIEKSENNASTKPKANCITDSSITLEPKQGYEYGITKGEQTSWQDNNMFNDLSPGTKYELSQRIKETDTHKPSSKSSNIVITKFKQMNYKTQEILDYIKKQESQDNKGIFIGGIDSYITRGEMAMLIVKSLGFTPMENDRFKDVKPNTILAKYIGTAYNYGIIAGTSETTFSPYELVTKEDALVMLKRVSKILNITDTIKDLDKNNFIDFDIISDYAKDSVIWGLNNSIIEIKSEILPKSNITKSEAMKMINELFDVIKV